MSSAFPVGLHFTKDHEWAKTDGRRVRIGITQHAVDALGDITLVQIDVKPGQKLEAHKPFGTVESVKAVSDLFVPVAGTVVEVNSALVERPETLNESPYDQAWMIVIETDAAIPSDLMDTNAYQAFVDSLAH